MSGCECKRDSAQPVINVLSVRFPFFFAWNWSGRAKPKSLEI